MSHWIGCAWWDRVKQCLYAQSHCGFVLRAIVAFVVAAAAACVFFVIIIISSNINFHGFIFSFVRSWLAFSAVCCYHCCCILFSLASKCSVINLFSLRLSQLMIESFFRCCFIHIIIYRNQCDFVPMLEIVGHILWLEIKTKPNNHSNNNSSEICVEFFRNVPLRVFSALISIRRKIVLISTFFCAFKYISGVVKSGKCVLLCLMQIKTASGICQRNQKIWKSLVRVNKRKY